jgi:hypothetical protein
VDECVDVAMTNRSRCAKLYSQQRLYRLYPSPPKRVPVPCVIRGFTLDSPGVVTKILRLAVVGLSLTVGYIAQHVASDSYLFCNNFGAMKATLPEKDTATPDSVKAKWPKEELVSKLKASFAFCAQAFDQLEDTKLGDQITMTFNGTSRNSTRINMVLGHALDLADHYSQLANYMRLNNLIPPSALPRPGR